MSHHYPAADVTCSYLQSLTRFLFDAFYYALAATDNCVLHTPDDSPGIFSDIHIQAVAYARSSDDADIYPDRLYLWRSSYASRLFDLPGGILHPYNIVAFLLVDYIEKFLRNEGR